MGLDFRIPRDRAIIMQNTAVSGGGSGYVSEYQTVYDSFTTKPSAAVAAADNTMVSALVAAGLWSTKLDIFDHFAQEVNSDGESLKNWISPGTFDPTLVNAPAHVSLEGFTGNGSTSYINSNWNPSVDGVNLVQDSTSIGIYCRTNNALTQRDIGAFDGTYNLQIIAQYSDNNAYVWLNNNVGTSVGNSDSRGMYISARLNANDQDLYRNKIKIIDGSDASTGVPNEDMFILGQGNVGAVQDPTTRQLSVAFAGAGLTQADVDIITDAFELRMDTLGKGIIP